MREAVYKVSDMHQGTDYDRPVRVLNLIASLHIGGAGRLVVRTIPALNDSLIESQVAYFLPRHDLVPELRAAGVEPIFLDHRGARDGVGTLRRLLAQISRAQPDIIHTNLALDRIFGSVAARIRKVPVITSLHTTVEGLDGRVLGYRALARSYAEAALSRHLSTAMVAVAGEVAQSHIRTLKFDPSRITIIDPGIPTEWLEPVPPQAIRRVRHQLGVCGTPVIVNTARLHPAKGQMSLIQAMKTVVRSFPQAQLVIAGDGELRPLLQAKAREIGLTHHIMLPGALSDVRGLLAMADVYVTASEREGRSIALLEAMAIGTPIVATRIPSHEEVIRDGETALLAAPGDPEGLGEKIVEMLGRHDRSIIGTKAKAELSSRYTMQGWTTALEALYLEVAGRR